MQCLDPETKEELLRRARIAEMFSLLLSAIVEDRLGETAEAKLTRVAELADECRRELLLMGLTTNSSNGGNHD